MQTNEKFIILEKKILDKAHHRSDPAMGIQWRGSHTGASGDWSHCFHNRENPSSEVQSNEKRNFAEHSEAQKFLKIEADRALQFKENRKLDLCSLKQNFIRKIFLKSRGTMY